MFNKSTAKHISQHTTPDIEKVTSGSDILQKKFKKCHCRQRDSNSRHLREYDLNVSR